MKQNFTCKVEFLVLEFTTGISPTSALRAVLYLPVLFCDFIRTIRKEIQTPYRPNPQIFFI